MGSLVAHPSVLTTERETQKNVVLICRNDNLPRKFRVWVAKTRTRVLDCRKLETLKNLGRNPLRHLHTCEELPMLAARTALPTVAGCLAIPAPAMFPGQPSA